MLNSPSRKRWKRLCAEVRRRLRKTYPLRTDVEISSERPIILPAELVVDDPPQLIFNEEDSESRSPAKDVTKLESDIEAIRQLRYDILLLLNRYRSERDEARVKCNQLLSQLEAMKEEVRRLRGE